MTSLFPPFNRRATFRKLPYFSEAGRGVYYKTTGATAPFTPAVLFASGEQGAWYDPSDMSTMFQDFNGATAVSAVEQPVSLILDKSQSLAIGSELVTNGSFDTDTNWVKGANWTISGGVATHATGAAGSLYQAISIAAGKVYLVTVTTSNMSGAGGMTVAYAAAGTTVGTINANGTYTYRVIAKSGDTQIFFYAASLQAVTIDNISVKELAGNHAYTPSTATASRPVLSARYNLLTKTEQFDDAAWTKTNVTVTANAAVAPDGTTTAEKLILNNGAVNSGSTNNLSQVATMAVNLSIRCAVYAKASEWGWLRLVHRNVAGNETGANFDLVNGVLGTVDAGVTATITNAGSGWYLCSIDKTTPATASTGAFRLIPDNTNSINSTGNGTNGILVWGADLRVANDGVSIPTYQRVNTSTDYDTTNFPMYLRFDGSDDYMLTGTITPGTDKAQVFAGVRKLSDAAAGILVELSTTIATNAGSLYMAAPENTSSERYSFSGRGSAASTNLQRSAWTISGTAPDTAVLTGTGDIATSTNQLRRNGVNATAATAAQGTGNYLAYPLYIGRRNGATVPYNGRLFGLIVRFGANLDNTQITNTETWMNGKTKAY